MRNQRLIDLAFNYVISISRAKPYNPQAIANVKFFRSYPMDDLYKLMSLDARNFCDECSLDKARDFVYKKDYFTPRDMYIINPLYYLYYTCLVFKLVDLYLQGESVLDFSEGRMNIYFNSLLDLEASKDAVDSYSNINERFKDLNQKLEDHENKPALLVDVKDFFSSIDVNKLIIKLKKLIGEHQVIEELRYFFSYCGFKNLPQFHYSIASSILSQFYLVEFDSKVSSLIENENMMFYRFVDDMYFIHMNGENERKKENRILNQLSFFLWEDGLVLNTSKIQPLNADDVKATIATLESKYDESQSTFSIETVVAEKAEKVIEEGNLVSLIEALYEVYNNSGVDLNEYMKLTDDYISNNDKSKILNHIIYSKKWKRMSDENLIKFLEKWEFILFNPTQFTVLYIMIGRYLEDANKIDREGKWIKRVLSFLYSNENFTYRDTLVAITYLFQNKRKNKELLLKIKEIHPSYVDFIEKYM